MEAPFVSMRYGDEVVEEVRKCTYKKCRCAKDAFGCRWCCCFVVSVMSPAKVNVVGCHCRAIETGRRDSLTFGILLFFLSSMLLTGSLPSHGGRLSTLQVSHSMVLDFSTLQPLLSLSFSLPLARP